MRALELLFVLPLLIYSCSPKTKSDNCLDKESILADTLLVVSDIQDKNLAPFQLTLEKVDLGSIKREHINSYTSGVLPKSENENFEFKEFSNAFFGIYYFSHRNTEIPFEANALIIREQGEWDYLDNDEKLVEFNTYSNLLNPFREIISIGDTKDEVVKRIGNNSIEIENNLIYYDSLGNAATLLINEDTVQAIRVGRYKAPNELNPMKLKW